MIGKLFNIPYSKFAKTVHGEMEKNKQKQNQNQKSEHHEHDASSPASLQIPEEIAIISKDELLMLVEELNEVECYKSIRLKFTVEDNGQNLSIRLTDKIGHTVQEYLPIQIKNLCDQIKKDKSEKPKGSILNLAC